LRQSTATIRVVLAEVTGLTAEFVKMVVAKQPDMRIVAEVAVAGELGHALETVGADVVVTALSSTQVPAAYHGLLFQIPSIAVLAIGADRRRVDVYNGTVVHEVALEHLVEVIRDLVGHREYRLRPARPHHD
jgi:hypothetical protein